MEGLANQDRTDGFAWELLVCEERHDAQLGQAFFDSYMERLAAKGCAYLRYLSSNTWVPLPEKWRITGGEMNPGSRAFLLQAADCYSFKERLNESYRRVVLEGYSWYDVCHGYFYSFATGKLIQYCSDNPNRTHLNMALFGAAARTIPHSNLRQNIDGFLNRHTHTVLPPYRRYMDKAEYVGVDTNGYNNISIGRENYFDNPAAPFRRTDSTLSSIGLPPDVAERMLAMTKVRTGRTPDCIAH